MTWTLTIPEVPPTENQQRRMHFRDYSRLLERWFYLVRCAPGFIDIPTAGGKRRVTITLRGRNTRDREGLHGCMKPVLDVLRPPKHDEGYYKSGKRAGQYWSRRRIGHGLIQEDDPAHLELEVRQEPLPRGQAPHLVLVLEDVTTGVDGST